MPTVAEVLAQIGVKSDTKAVFGEYAPTDFQIEGAKQFIERVNYGLYDQTGVGKTLTLFLSVLAWRALGNKVALMTKPGLFTQLLHEWDSILVGIEESPSKTIGDPILLLTHASLRIKRYVKALNKEYDVIIIDEYHKLRNPEGRRFLTLKALTEAQEKAVLIATGTPLTKDLRDSYSCVAITSPLAYKDYKAFCSQHVKYKQVFMRDKNINLIDGFKNEKRLKKRLLINGRRILKQDVWKGLEKPMVSPRFLDLHDTQREIYEEFQEFLIYENSDGELFDASYSPVLKFNKGIVAITNPQTYEKGAVSCVLEDIKELASEICIDNKLIVFTLYDTTANYYAEALAEFNPARITGAIKQDTKFKEDASCKVLISTMGAGAEGYSFQKVSSYMYLAEYLPVPGYLEQAANRIYRPGQLSAATLYIPHVKKTLYVTSLITKAQDRHESNKKVMDTDFSLS